MNSLERSLIEKAGYDNGWEIVLDSVPEQVSLASALHRGCATIKPADRPNAWILTFPPGPLADELSKAEAAKLQQSGSLQVENDSDLGRLLVRMHIHEINQ